MSTTQMQPASSSVQPSTTTHLNSKRVRDIEIMGTQDESSDNPLIKKSRIIEGGEAKVGLMHVLKKTLLNVNQKLILFSQV